MTYNEKYNVSPEFENLFNFKSKEEEFEHEAKMLMFRFLSEMEKLNNSNPLKKKELAKAIGTSASYITQLYQGDKLIYLITLAKLKQAYDFTFEIKAKSNIGNYSDQVEQKYKVPISGKNLPANNGFNFYKNPNYNKSEILSSRPKGKLKVA
jgi:transcriptional regulator with XRE-family HTH domain